MPQRRHVAGAGTGVTVSLLAAVAVIETVDIEFTGLMGVPVGVVSGSVVLVAAVAGYDHLGRWLRTVVDAVAGVGFGVLVGYPAIVLVTDPVPGLPVRQMLTVAALVGLVFAAAVSIVTADTDGRAS